MSDTANLTNNNIEPSMEDILSSIRKVIAEDLSQKEADVVQATTEVEPQTGITAPEVVEADTIEPTEVVVAPDTEQQPSAEDHLDDILELDNLLGDMDDLSGEPDETMELIQLEGDTEEAPMSEGVQDLEFESLIVPAPETTGINPVIETVDDSTDFDETLDLVMDSDESDYVTEKFTPVSDTPLEETPKSAETYDGPKVDIIENLLFDVLNDAEDLTETAQEPEQVHDPLQASASDDMDLVKSLLDDLMDEPISETVSASVETAIAETSFDVEDNFSEDDLLIPDPEATPTDDGQSEAIEEFIQASPTPVTQETVAVVAEDIFDTLVTETPISNELELGSETENELTQLAREIAEVRNTPADNISAADDVIELSTPDYASKLAISSSLVTGAGTTEEEPQGIIATEAESDLESLQQLIAETDLEAPIPEKPETPEEIEIIQSPIQEPMKEEEAMATPLKNDALSDAGTQQEVGNAFASLTNTVQEHALAEENGPPIGELVKEALRPMLQEWLDKNLKAMVQRAVTKEIKRISTGK